MFCTYGTLHVAHRLSVNLRHPVSAVSMDGTNDDGATETSSAKSKSAGSAFELMRKAFPTWENAGHLTEKKAEGRHNTTEQ